MDHRIHWVCTQWPYPFTSCDCSYLDSVQSAWYQNKQRVTNNHIKLLREEAQAMNVCVFLLLKAIIEMIKKLQRQIAIYDYCFTNKSLNIISLTLL